MNKQWSSESFCNRWLREESVLPAKRRSSLTLSMLEPSELELVLDIILKYGKRMNTGKVRIEVCLGEIKLSVVDSKETYMSKNHQGVEQ